MGASYRGRAPSQPPRAAAQGQPIPGSRRRYDSDLDYAETAPARGDLESDLPHEAPPGRAWGGGVQQILLTRIKGRAWNAPNRLFRVNCWTDSIRALRILDSQANKAESRIRHEPAE